MTTVSAQELFRDVALILGWDPDNLSEREWMDIRDAVSVALKQAWEFAFWPDLMRKYHTALKPSWSAAYISAFLTYDADTVLYDTFSQAYYQALVDTADKPTAWNSTTKEWEFTSGIWHPVPNTEATTTWDPDETYVLGDVVTFDDGTYVAMGTVGSGQINSPALNPTGWHMLNDFRYAYDHTGWAGREPIGLVQSITDNDPEEVRNASAFTFETFADKTVVQNPLSAKVWIKYRLNCPKLVGEAFTSSATHTEAPLDQQIYGQSMNAVSAPVIADIYGVIEFGSGDPTGTRTKRTWYFDEDTGNQWVYNMTTWTQIVGT